MKKPTTKLLNRIVKSFTLLAACVLAALSPAAAADFDMLQHGGTFGDSKSLSSVNDSISGPRKAMIASGGGHTLAIKDDGTLWAWGRNDKGQLGDGTTENRNAPIQIGEDSDWVAVAAGFNFSVAVKANGTLWSWGTNENGVLGNGSYSDSTIPTRVGTGATWRAVAAGRMHTLALRTDGSLWTWGANGAGQLGIDPDPAAAAPSGASKNTPTQISGAWTAVAAGEYHSLAVNNAAYWHGGFPYTYPIYSWGANTANQLSRVTVGSSDWNVSVAVSTSNTPLWTGTTSGGTVAAGADFSLTLNDVGNLYAWGSDSFGQTKPGGSVTNFGITLLRQNVSSVSAGLHHVVALDSLGSVIAWGRSDVGQVSPYSSPSDTAGFTPLSVAGGNKAVVAGYKTSTYVDGNGSVLTRGRGIEGQHGDGAVQTVSSPSQRWTGSAWTQVAVAERHSLAIDSNGRLWAWGDNSAAQLGDGTNADSAVPISPDGQASVWIKVAVGPNNSAAIKSSGELWVWGSNYYGQFGDGSTTASLTMKQIAGTWSDVAVGQGHVVAVKSNGELWAWGNNMNSQLGFAKPSQTQSTQLIPKKVGSSSLWTKVAAGDNHSLGLQGSTLYAWGQNVLGQLGNGSNTDANSPIKIGSLAWASIYAAGSTSAAISPLGKLFVWGSNEKGQLGDGGTLPSNSPKAFLASYDFSSVALSVNSVLARRTDGTVWATGANQSGQLGDGGTSSKKTPVSIGLTNVGAVATGGSSSVALVGGELYVWGSNRYGQLGEGSAELGQSAAIVAELPSVSINASALTKAGSSTSASGSTFQFEDGDMVTFSAVPSGTGPFSYQWKKDEVDINGATSSTYEISAASGATAGVYSVSISSAFGSNIDSSNTLTASMWTAPKIVEQPESQNVLTGSLASLAVVAEGSVVDYVLKKGGTLVAASSLPSFSVNEDPAQGAGSYTITLRAYKNLTLTEVVSSAVAVKFYSPVELDSAVDDASPILGTGGAIIREVNSGVSVTLSVSVKSSLIDVEYQWRKDLQNISGANSSTLTVSATAFSSGQYDVVVSNPASSVTSNAFSLRVFSKPAFTRQPASQVVENDRSATLTVAVTGFQAPSLQWFKDGEAIAGATSASLTIKKFSSLNVGGYYVRASNASGFATSEVATLSLPAEVVGKPIIKDYPRSQAVKKGETATFTVNALNATQFQWRKNGVPIPGATSFVLEVVNVQPVDVASYSVLVSNSVASVLSPAVNISIRTEVDAGGRRDLFNSVVGSNSGLFGARFRRATSPVGAPEGYIRMNVTKVGTASGLYMSGLSVSRFSTRFQLVSGKQVAEVTGIAGGTLRISVTNDPTNPVVSAQFIGAGEGETVKLARLGTKNLTLSKAYTGTLLDDASGDFQGFTMTRVNLVSGTVFVSGMLPRTGKRFSASSGLYADPEGQSAASMSDLIIRLDSSTRLFATWKLETDVQSGDLSVATAVVEETEDYKLTGANYSPAPIGELLSPFVSTRDEAVISHYGTEIGRFSAVGNRLVTGSSTFAAQGGRLSVSYLSSTGQVSGLLSMGVTVSSMTSGSSVVTVSSTKGLSAGMTVANENLPSGTIILAVNDSEQRLTLSQNANKTATNVAMAVGPLRPFVGVILQGDFRQNGGLIGIGVTRNGDTIRFEPAN